IVEKESPGFSVGKKEDKLGIRASSTCELIMEDMRVPKANILGQAGKGYKIAIETLNEGRIGIGAQMLGLAQGAWEAAAKYATERKQFGKAIADFQGIQQWLSQIASVPSHTWQRPPMRLARAPASGRQCRFGLRSKSRSRSCNLCRPVRECSLLERACPP